ncbi:flippase [Clostridium botulinum C]|uniref:Flippase n=2 Tax=Clostridium botulinum TaxID=1491 RepID=A0A9Q4TJM4_CLOBO|nr:flippase [Clostridium botulinum]MCD3193995.1 flippase [Clostridium botulinum C]MCD3199376.1 flippase [Clostridium botulinum C]MCD3204851.1 flippase [Clostridium botulinum C]MCD3207676.1 flippase [Clostridium botulinum C]MCD3224866.1 flippase [Clostridium botulinum C]
MSKINKIAKNLLSVGLSSLVAQLLTFLMIAYYARILSIEGFGRINLAQSIITYFTMITLFGFQTLGTREISKNKNNKEELLGNIIITRLIVALICFLMVIAIAFATNKGVIFRNILIVYGLTLFPLAFNIDWFYSGIQQMQHNAIYNVLKSGIPFLLIFILFRSEKNIIFIPIFTLCGLLFASIYHIIVLKRKTLLKISLKINKKQIAKYVKFSIPFLVSGLLSMINCNVDSLIIGFTRSEYELGIYSSAYKIIFFLTNLIAVIFTPFFPLLISYYHEKDINNLEKVVKNLCKIVILIGVPVLIGGIILSKEIIILLFGQKYVKAYVPFIILLIYILVLFMRENYGYSLNAWNKENKYLKSVIISALTNLILNLIFIPIYGIIAASITTLVSEVLNFFIMRKYSIKIVKTNYITNFIKVIIPVVLMAIVVLALKYFNINVMINIVLAIIVYFIAIIITRYVTIDELKGFIKK